MFSFPEGNKHYRYRKDCRLCHAYCPETSTFTESQSMTLPDVCDGSGFSTWKLDFHTPTSGVAILQAQDISGNDQLGDIIPFPIEPLR